MECSQLASLTEGEWAAISLDQIEVVISRLQDCCISFSLLVQNLTEGSEGHAQCTVLNDSFHSITFITSSLPNGKALCIVRVKMMQVIKQRLQ